MFPDHICNCWPSRCMLYVQCWYPLRNTNVRKWIRKHTKLQFLMSRVEPMEVIGVFVSWNRYECPEFHWGGNASHLAIEYAMTEQDAATSVPARNVDANNFASLCRWPATVDYDLTCTWINVSIFLVAQNLRNYSLHPYPMIVPQ